MSHRGLVLLTTSAFMLGCHGRPGQVSEPGSSLAPCPSSPNCVSTEATDDVHGMRPVPFSGAPEAAQALARAALLAEPRMRIVLDVPGYLRAEATSRIFRFVDDVEVVIDTTASVFRFRSASRLGKGDMGVNRARMQRVTERLVARGGAPAPRDSAAP